MKNGLTTMILAALAALPAWAGKPVEIQNSAFEQVGKDGVPVGWRAHPNWHAERAGHNGSGGYVFECTDAKKRRGGRPSQIVKLEPGKRYLFSALVRADGLTTERKTAAQGIGLYVEGYNASNKWVFGAQSKPMASGKNRDWTKVTGLTRVIPEDCVRAEIQPMVNGNGLGRAMIDNVYLEEYEVLPVEGVYSDKYRREAVSGKACFHAVLNTDLKANRLEDYAAAFSYVGADGTRKSVAGELVSGTHARVELPVDGFAFGTNDVVCTLSLGGKALGSGKCAFARLAAPTPRRAYIDGHLRTIVDGKPFFPLGMYFSKVTESNLIHYTQAPFNVLMPYRCPDTAEFDLCQKYGVKVIYNMQGGFRDKDGGKACITDRIARFKDHPALLAWYTNDEKPLTDIPRLTMRQGWIEELDKDHPTWSVQDVYTELSHYLPTYDVLGMDPYPIGRKMPIGRCIYTMRQSDKDAFGMRAVWHVPQAFGWNWLFRKETAKMICPTAKELDNMSWQAIAGGANGLVYYAYHHIVEPRATKNNDDEFTWEDVCAIARGIKRYEDVLLSLPGPKVADVPEDLAVRTWSKGGETWLLAVNCTTNAQSAAISVEGRAERLQLDLGPIDYRMMRLVPPCASAALELVPGQTEVVVEKKASPVVQFAAEELTQVLAEAWGEKVPVVSQPSGKKAAIVLGENAWSRAAGIDVNAGPRDTYFIKTAGDRVYLAGRDNPSQHPLRSPRTSSSLERGTLFAVYAFLEDYAGVRFYFPGELGTIVPKTAKIAVPDVDKAVTPDYLVREWYNGRKAYWFGKTANDKEGERMKKLDWLRLRMGTMKIPLCHGTRNFQVIERFGKSHPEYFSLKPNGSRHNDPHATHPGQFCWTSGVVDELYEDVKAALTGKKPSDRGMTHKHWPNSFDLENRIVDLMPQDGQPACYCENCQKMYKAGEDPVWAATKKIAERLTADGLDAKVTQMCYSRSRKVPDFDLPSNVLVQVAVRGQWSLRDPKLVEKEHAQIFAWQKKLGHKVWLWTYPGKHPSVGPDFDGIPQLSMHAWTRYYADLKDSIIGGFSESETDRFSFNYLNYYVYSRMCWDTSVDVDAILDEHYRLMFGAAADEMKAFYTFLETKWMTKLVGESKDTEIGPVGVVPSWETIFREIYPPEEITKLDAFVAAALKRVPDGSLEARRIRLIADEYVGGIRAAEKRYRDRIAAVDGYRMKVGKDKPILLRERVFRGKRWIEPGLEVRTEVTTWREDGKLRFRFFCEEPHMDSLAEKERPDDDPQTWQDNSVEVYLCPDGNRTRKHQIIVNSRGACYSSKIIVFGKKGGHSDVSWGAGVTAKVVRGEKEWTAEIDVPLAELENCREAFPASFTRARTLDGVKGSGFYLWGPETLQAFGDSENFGTIEY